MTDRRTYKRDWMRRKRAAHPEINFKRTLAGGRPSRATKPPRQPGECVACHQVFPLTAEFFVTVTKKMKDGALWSKLASECRTCRNARFRQHYDKNREAQVARVIEYQKAKPEKKRAHQMKRYAQKVRGTAAWADQRKIETIYAISDYLTLRTGIPHQVDHFYPIMGKTSCGLHVPENMRVIPAKDNQRKGNRT